MPFFLFKHNTNTSDAKCVHLEWNNTLQEHKALGAITFVGLFVDQAALLFWCTLTHGVCVTERHLNLLRLKFMARHDSDQYCHSKSVVCRADNNRCYAVYIESKVINGQTALPVNI